MLSVMRWTFCVRCHEIRNISTAVGATCKTKYNGCDSHISVRENFSQRDPPLIDPSLAMQQTLLSLVALLIATLLSFNQMQASLQSQEQTVRAEIEMMALGVAMQTMEVVRAQAFDEETKSLPLDSIITDPSNFTDEDMFGVTGDCKLHPDGSGIDCETVEEFNETKGTVPFLAGTDEISFEVTKIDVRYVTAVAGSLDTAGADSTGEFQKEVVISVRDDPPGDRSPRLPEPIQYSQVLSYP